MVNTDKHAIWRWASYLKVMCFVTNLHKCKTKINSFTKLYEYLFQQIAESKIICHLMYLPHVSATTKSSSGRYIKRHKSETNSVKDISVLYSGFS